MSKNILVNLPEPFFVQPELQESFARLEKLGAVRKTSHNTPEEIANDLTWAESVIMWSWPVLDDKLLDTAGTLNYAGHIDLGQRGAKAELGRGIPVSTSRAGFSPAVAEMALTLILTTLRKTSDYHAQMRQSTERWVESFPAGIDPLERELTGSSVGIIGLGQVGRRLAHFLNAFDVNLSVVDPYVSEEVIAQHNGTRVEIDELIETCDIVVLCAASNDGTSKLINEERIAKFRKNAILINVARGALVDTPALIQRLKQNDLFAALDVFDVEPLETDSELRTLSNAYLTPHSAGGLMTSFQRNIDWLIDDLEAVLEDRPQNYPVTEQMIPALDDQ